MRFPGTFSTDQLASLNWSVCFSLSLLSHHVTWEILLPRSNGSTYKMDGFAPMKFARPTMHSWLLALIGLSCPLLPAAWACQGALDYLDQDILYACKLVQQQVSAASAVFYPGGPNWTSTFRRCSRTCFQPLATIRMICPIISHPAARTRHAPSSQATPRTSRSLWVYMFIRAEHGSNTLPAENRWRQPHTICGEGPNAMCY